MEEEDEDYGKGKGIHTVAENNGEYASVYPYDYYPETPERDPWLGAVAPKSTREEEDDGEDGCNVRPREDKRKGKSTGGKGPQGPRARGPCWRCGGPHFQLECPMKGKRKGPSPTSPSSWRPRTFPSKPRTVTVMDAEMSHERSQMQGQAQGRTGKAKMVRGWNYFVPGRFAYNEGIRSRMRLHLFTPR